MLINMDVFLSRLPDKTTLSELENTCLSLLSKKFRLPFTKSPELISCRIMEIRDKHDRSEYHGLIHIKPDDVATWFIKNCRGSKIHGKRLLAHQYKIRDSSWKPDYFNEADHRRPSLKTCYINIKSPSYTTRPYETH